MRGRRERGEVGNDIEKGGMIVHRCEVNKVVWRVTDCLLVRESDVIVALKRVIKTK